MTVHDGVKCPHCHGLDTHDVTMIGDPVRHFLCLDCEKEWFDDPHDT